jgi:hypothetical protein
LRASCYPVASRPGTALCARAPHSIRQRRDSRFRGPVRLGNDEGQTC